MAIYFLEGLVSTVNDPIAPFAHLARKLGRILKHLLHPARRNATAANVEPFR